MENAALKDLLKEHMELKGLSVKKVSESTGIPERYMEALVEGKNNNLPPAPYVRGYINKLAHILDFDKETIWRLYKEQAPLQSSGAWDKLPSNRFAIQSINKKWLIIGLGATFLVFYLSTNVYQILRNPNLEVTYPAIESSISETSSIILKGNVDSSNTLTINGEEVFVDKDGHFIKEQILQPGLNTIEFMVKKFLGKEYKVIRQVIYQPPMIDVENGSINSPQSKNDKNTKSER